MIAALTHAGKRVVGRLTANGYLFSAARAR